MNTVVANLLNGQVENHIMPFFWQHGEEEGTLREYMRVINDSGIQAVCVESRPHPDFCGEKWWRDMDIILDEAKKRGMKVWILDDSHFPTGYANGALNEGNEELCRQGICYEGKTVKGGKKITVDLSRFLNKKNEKVTLFSMFAQMGVKPRVFGPDTFLSATAIRMDGPQEALDLKAFIHGDKLEWNAPEGTWKIGLCKLSRNCGAHRNYINMMDPESCHLLIQHVYEPHWEHYQEEFGKTIAGFFSDEPELGNGALYSNEPLGSDQDLPWSRVLEGKLKETLGEDWKNALPYLWEADLDPEKTGRVRFAYMDTVTTSVKTAFSEQIGNWCRSHGVEYIGHVVEDNNNHARTGGSLGHYFRGLYGQDMAGIDDIGGQVLPQGEDGPNTFMRVMKRDGEFYHYVLGKLGPSLAAIDPKKHGRTMCEIFGNYGWSEGLRLEKFLTDHFLVNGVNYFVPHAFSPKAFPDPDCPPHFYAHGHNPQYRHFKSLMEYMNRVSTLLTGGRHIAPVALLYHGEAEWSGKAMLMQKAARQLLDDQIDFDILPTDVFRDREAFMTDLSKEFRVNTQTYQALVIPYAQYISPALTKAIQELLAIHVPVYFVDALPEGYYEGGAFEKDALNGCQVLPIDDLAEGLRKAGIGEISLDPQNNRVRYLHYENGSHLYLFVNEGKDTFRGTVRLSYEGPVVLYHAWDNVLEEASCKEEEGGLRVRLEIEPYHSCILILDAMEGFEKRIPLQRTVNQGNEIPVTEKWSREICKSIFYPAFTDKKAVTLPDHLAKEMPKFSGWVRYTNQVEMKKGTRTILEITDAFEGVEVFVNGISAGVQVVPKYRFDITDLIQDGKNEITIEVSTTLERERAAAKDRNITEKLMAPKELSSTGITGEVHIYTEGVRQ